MKPEEIEKKSFLIIDSEAGPHDFSPREWSIVRRMIHTTADFEFIKTVRFHPAAIDAGISAIRAKKPLITDTKMIQVALRKKEMDLFGVESLCFIQDPQVVKKAAGANITRAQAAVDIAVERFPDGIYVIGNAPTALLRLLCLVREGRAAPSLVVGLPVGFVNALESKQELVKTNLPYISNLGRKGGSNLAAAVANALLIMASEKE